MPRCLYCKYANCIKSLYGRRLALNTFRQERQRCQGEEFWNCVQIRNHTLICILQAHSGTYVNNKETFPFEISHGNKFLVIWQSRGQNIPYNLNYYVGYSFLDVHERQYFDVPRDRCATTCHKDAFCSCGTLSGDYVCACEAGFSGNGIRCERK